MSDDTHPSGDTGVSGWWQRLVQGRAGDVKTREEITEFLATIRDRGILAADEYAMLLGVLQVSDTQVRDIMVPRSQMIVLAKDQSADEMLKVISPQQLAALYQAERDFYNDLIKQLRDK